MTVPHHLRVLLVVACALLFLGGTGGAAAEPDREDRGTERMAEKDVRSDRDEESDEGEKPEKAEKGEKAEKLAREDAGERSGGADAEDAYEREFAPTTGSGKEAKRRGGEHEARASNVATGGGHQATPSAPAQADRPTGGAAAEQSVPDAISGGAQPRAGEPSGGARARARRKRTPSPSRARAQRPSPAPAAVPAASPPPSTYVPLTPAPGAARKPARSVERTEAERAEPRPVISRAVTHIVRVVPEQLRVLVAVLAILSILLGAVTAFAALRARRLDRQRRRLAEDVGLLQSALLPVLPDRIAAAAVSAAYRPAHGLAAGGDFFDAFPLVGGRTGVIVGDVEGQGRRTLALTALVRYTVRAHLERGLEPRHALQAADAVLAGQLGGTSAGIAVAVYDPMAGELTYACAGQPQPVLVGHEHRHVLGTATPAVGAGPGAGRRQTSVALPPRTAAVFHTDGLADARAGEDRVGAEGLAARAERLGPGLTAEALLSPLARSAQTDDMTALVLRAAPEAPDRPLVSVEELEVRGPDVIAAHAFLDECGVQPAEADVAMREARGVITRNGAAVLEVRRADGSAEVTVRRPSFQTLRAGGRTALPTAADRLGALA